MYYLLTLVAIVALYALYGAFTVDAFNSMQNDHIAHIAAIAGAVRVNSVDMLKNAIQWCKNCHYSSDMENGISNVFYTPDDNGLFPVSSPYCKKLDAQSVINHYAGTSKHSNQNGIERDAVLTVAVKAADNAAKLATLDLQAFRNYCERNSSINRNGTKFNPIVDNASKRSKSQHAQSKLSYRDWLAIDRYYDEVKQRKAHNSANVATISASQKRELSNAAKRIAERRRQQLNLAETSTNKAVKTVNESTDKLETLLTEMERFERDGKAIPDELFALYHSLLKQST